MSYPYTTDQAQPYQASQQFSYGQPPPNPYIYDQPGAYGQQQQHQQQQQPLVQGQLHTPQPA
jgi:hypothetical protein